jgi:ADP-glucose type glycogen/starch synthase
MPKTALKKRRLLSQPNSTMPMVPLPKEEVKTIKSMAGPRILIITPEITYLPAGMGNMAERMSAKAGGLADVSASLVSALFDLGADVHVALPNYRRMFNMDVFNLHSQELRRYHQKLSKDRIHLAEDRIFYYRDEVYSGYEKESSQIALAFQREVINNIIPSVRPDLIHCNDWMTGLIPAFARRMGIPCLFTVHNIHTHRIGLAEIEDRGIDAAEFWQHLYFDNTPHSYEESRAHNKVDMLTSGIFASHFINTVSPRFLWEITQGWHNVVPASVRRELSAKAFSGCGTGILNAPDPSYDPETDSMLSYNFSTANVAEGKAANKAAMQEELGLELNPDAPLFLWPSRLDPIQKGPQLLCEILYKMVSDYWEWGLQVAVVANGPYQKHLHDIVRHHDLARRVAVVDFDERLSHLGYAAADFMLMPSLFEPCGLPQMISPLYGTLPVVHATGGLYDTIQPLNLKEESGNGFRFEVYGSAGLRWAVDEALRFYQNPPEIRTSQIQRVMDESKIQFSHEASARAYIKIYENMLERPLVAKGTKTP